MDRHPASALLQEILAYLLSPEARQLRPLLVRELAVAADLFARDRARRAVAALPGLLTPRLPLLGVSLLPPPPLPPVFVPGLGLMSLDQAVRFGPTARSPCDLDKHRKTVAPAHHRHGGVRLSPQHKWCGPAAAYYVRCTT